MPSVSVPFTGSWDSGCKGVWCCELDHVDHANTHSQSGGVLRLKREVASEVQTGVWTVDHTGGRKTTRRPGDHCGSLVPPSSSALALKD